MLVLDETRTRILSGVLFAIAANLLWGLAFLIPQILSSFTSIEITIGRYLFYGTISLIIFLVKGASRFGKTPSDWNGATETKSACADLQPGSAGFVCVAAIYNRQVFIRALLFAFAGNIGYYFFLVYGIKYAGAPVTTLIIGTLPITVSLYGNWLQREYPFSKLLTSIVMIFIGFLIISIFTNDWVQDSEKITVLERYLGLLSAITALSLWTWYGVANSTFLKNNPHITSSTWSTLIGVNTLVLSLAFVFIMFLIKDEMLTKLARHIRFNDEVIPLVIGSLILGVVVSWGGTIMWNKASSLLPISLAGQLLVLESISSLTYLYVYYFRLPSFFEVLGVTIIIGGVILALRNTSILSQTTDTHN